MKEEEEEEGGGRRRRLICSNSGTGWDNIAAVAPSLPDFRMPRIIDHFPQSPAGKGTRGARHRRHRHRPSPGTPVAGPPATVTAAAPGMKALAPAEAVTAPPAPAPVAGDC